MNTTSASAAPVLDRVGRFKDALFIGAFAAATTVAMFGWIAALGWASLRLIEWTLS